MQFSDSTNKQGLIQEIDFFIPTDLTSYPIAERTRNINQWNAKVIGWIFSAANPRFEYDDTNYITLPFATTDLVSGTSQYRFDASWLDISRIDIIDANGYWRELQNFDQSDIYQQGYDDFERTAGTPAGYDLISDVFTLKPTPNYSQTAGIKVWFERVGDLFVAADTTKAPGFNPQFHRVLSLGASYDYALAKNLPLAATLRQEIGVIKDEIYEFYGSRNKGEKTNMRTRRQSFR